MVLRRGPCTWTPSQGKSHKIQGIQGCHMSLRKLMRDITKEGDESVPLIFQLLSLSPHFILSLLSQEANTSSLHISNIFLIKHGKKMNNEEHVHPIFQILPKYVEIKSCKHEPLSTFSPGHESNIKTIKQIKTNTNHPYHNRNPKFPKSIILSN